MIWATVSSRSCFCWLYRASPSLPAKNIINLISVLTIWWCPCVVFSCVVGRGCLLWPVHSLGKTLLAFALLHSILQDQIFLLLQVFLDFLLLRSSPLLWKGHLFWVLVLDGPVGLHRTIQLHPLQYYWSGHRLGLPWYWMIKPDNVIKQGHYFANKGPSSLSYSFSSSHVWMWQLDYKESWVPKNWCFWTVVLETTLESPLDCKEIQPVHPKGNQSWIFIGRTDAETETPILWPPDVKNCLIGIDPDAGKDWRWEEKGMIDEMVGCITDLIDMSLSKPWVLLMNREAWHAAVHGIVKSWTRLCNCTELKHCIIDPQLRIEQ